MRMKQQGNGPFRTFALRELPVDVFMLQIPVSNVYCTVLCNFPFSPSFKVYFLCMFVTLFYSMINQMYAFQSNK